MNEAKRQLAEKIGDTSERATRVRENVAQVITRRTKTRQARRWPYYAVGTALTMALLAFMLTPLLQLERPSSGGDSISYTEELRQYLMPNNSVAYFEGEGYAHVDFELKTKDLAPNFVQTIERSAAIEQERIYYITDDAIYIVFEAEVVVEPKSWTTDELQALTTNLERRYFAWPMTADVQIDDYTVKSLDATITTPFMTFTNVIVFEQTLDNITFREYYAKGYGFIRSEMLEDDEMLVYRELTTMGEPSPTFELTQQIGDVEEAVEKVEPTETVTTNEITNAPAQDEQALPAEVTLTSALTGDTRAFPTAELLPIREALQYSDSYEQAIAAMSFIELYVPLDGTYSLLNVNCQQAVCDVYFVSHVKDYRYVHVGTGRVDTYVEFSPSMQRALIRLAMEESAYVTRHQLAIVDVFSMQRNYVQTNTQYFSAATWPIEKYGWQDDETIALKVAEVTDTSTETLEGWKINSGTLMDVEIAVPYK